uniref:Uncharacterized protein n=1 Tax=Trichogramma kaykai TaxID=54128 RepID=A0ABD2WBI7_9HYME
MIERDDHVYQRMLRAVQRDAVTQPVADWANALSDEEVSAELQRRGLIVSPEKEINRDRLLSALCYSADKHCSMQWDNERDGVLPVFMPVTSMSPSKGAIKRSSATDKQTNKSKRSPKDRSHSEEVRTRIFTSRAATLRPKELEPTHTSGLPAPLIPTIAMWPAADGQVREAPANNTAAATDFFRGPELTPPETPRRDAKSRENVFSLSPRRSESEVSDEAQTVVQVPPPQPNQLLAINMRLDQDLAPRTSSNASRRSSHSSRHHSGKSESKASRTPSLPRESSSHHQLRDTPPHVDQSPAVKTSLNKTQVVEEHRARDVGAQYDGDTTSKRTEISKVKKSSKKSEAVAEASSSSGESNTRSRK